MTCLFLKYDKNVAGKRIYSLHLPRSKLSTLALILG